MILNHEDILEILPHRYPMLLVDLMPGVLLTEAIAQVGGIALLYPEENRGLTPMFTGIDKVRFRHPVKPGDQVRMEVDIVKIKGKMGKVEGRAYVGDKLCASGEYMFALV